MEVPRGPFVTVPRYKSLRALTQNINFHGSVCTCLYFSSRLTILVIAWESCLSVGTVMSAWLPWRLPLASAGISSIGIEGPVLASPSTLGTSQLLSQGVATWYLQTELTTLTDCSQSSLCICKCMKMHCCSWSGLHHDQHPLGAQGAPVVPLSALHETFYWDFLWLPFVHLCCFVFFTIFFEYRKWIDKTLRGSCVSLFYFHLWYFLTLALHWHHLKNFKNIYILKFLDPTLDRLNRNLESGSQATAYFKSSPDDFEAQLGFLSSSQYKEGLAVAVCCNILFTRLSNVPSKWGLTESQIQGKDWKKKMFII